MMPAGRPTKYKKKYCKELVDHMSKGLSYESFAAVVGTWHGTLYNWEKQYPEFLEAKKLAFDKCRMWWEAIGIQGMLGKHKNFSAAVFCFNMKNRFKWKDKVEVTTEDEDGTSKPVHGGFVFIKPEDVEK